MFPVADDFAAIAKRLKEIQAEVATETAAKASRRSQEEQSQPHEVLEDAEACA
jgi:tetrahydromethanopterin S-methyltransferase subunit G